MYLQDIFNLYEFNYWAKHRLLSVIEPLTDEQFTKDMGSSMGGIQGTLVHIMGAEEIWLKRWKQQPISGIPKAEDFPTLPPLVGRWDMVEHEMMGFCHMLKSDDDLLTVIPYKDLKGNPYSQPLYQMMQHLVNHSSYHRGQVVTMLRQLGQQAIGTDMIAFFRERF